MSLEGKMKSGRLYCEFGHELEENKAYEQKIQNQRVHCKELVYDYNQTRPSNGKEKRRILDELLAEAGEEIWIESPAFFSYGCNTHIDNIGDLSFKEDGTVRIRLEEMDLLGFLFAGFSDPDRFRRTD